MSAPASLPIDALATLLPRDTQTLAARMAQDVFASLFRQTAVVETEQATEAFRDLAQQCRNWSQAAGTPDGQAARLALLVSGLDQWGLAYSQAFQITAIPALSALLGSLRNGLDARQDARFQWYFSQIEQVEADAIDFKVELRRSIHLALWHAMAACESDAQAEAILVPLGSLMAALDQRMPTLGWRLLADALANIQIALLNDPGASAIAQNSTQQLFEALRNALPTERYREILAHAGQVVLAWQQAKRREVP